MEATYLIKSKISEHQFEEIVYKWLIKGDYTPDDITENITPENNRLPIPLYFHIHNYSGTCSAAIGYRVDRSYYYTDPVTNKRVFVDNWVTEWHPHSQNVQGSTTTIVYAGKSLPKSLTAFVEDMDWTSQELHRMTEDYPNRKVLMDLFEFPEFLSWFMGGLKKADKEALRQTLPKLPSFLVDNVLLDIKFADVKSFAVIAPYWRFNYRYEDKEYYIMVDGNNPTRITGTRPVDQKRKDTVNSLKWIGWLAGLSSIFCTLYFFSGSLDNIDFTWENIAIVVFGIGLTWVIVKIAVWFVKWRSREIRTKLLSRMMKSPPTTVNQQLP